MRALLRFLDGYKRPFILSLILGLAIAFWMNDSATGIIIGLLSNIIFMFAEHFAMVSRLSTYIDTHREIVDSDKEIIALAISMRGVKNECPGFWNGIARDAVVTLEQDLKSLRTGRWVVHSFDVFADVAAKLFNDVHLKSEYCGTSITRDYEDYWRSAPAQRFAKATEAAMSRGIKVRRIFICPTVEDLKRTMPVMQKQHDAGVEVRWALEDEVPKGTSCVDCGIWDRKVAVELSESKNRGVDFRARFHLADTEVARYVNIFDALFDAGRKFVPEMACYSVRELSSLMQSAVDATTEGH